MHWHSASGYRQVPYRDPHLGASRGAPGPGGPRGRPGGNFRPPARGAPGGPGGLPGGPGRAPAGPPKRGPYGALYINILILKGGVQGGTPWVHDLAPGAPRAPGGKKVHIFLGI